MKIISIDIGIKNFAYVVINSDDNSSGECKIEDWNIVELCDKSTNASKVDLIEVGETMKQKFSEIFENNYFDMILIENQIGRNAIRMKMLQGMVAMYFIMIGYSKESILNYNAINKLKNFMKGKQKTTYQERKKMSKDICKGLVENKFTNMNELYNKSKKKDDLADCLLQGLDYLKKNTTICESYFSIIDTEN